MIGRQRTRNAHPKPGETVSLKIGGRGRPVVGRFRIANPYIAVDWIDCYYHANSVDGREFKLSDFKGKYVLLDFWATWCGPCIAELPYLREAHQKFGARNDFVLVSLSIDDAIEKPRNFASKNDMPWKQGFLRKSDVPTQYGVYGIPAIFLVGPEGKILSKDFRGADISRELSKWLK